jgi:PPP family 3-phenylpropionic acid transporter
MGLGGMLGSLFGGYYWEAFSPELVFTMAAIACGVAFVIAYMWVGREITQNKAALG